MSQIFEQMLSKLQKVNRRGKNWVACCPAHDDSNPSLSLCLLPDDRILIKCWAGCDVSSIVTALGFDLSDLFPEPIAERQYQHFRSLERLSLKKPDDKIEHEKRILEIAKSDRANGKKLNPEELIRERQAYDRVKAYEKNHR